LYEAFITLTISGLLSHCWASHDGPAFAYCGGYTACESNVGHILLALPVFAKRGIIRAL
jgi:hypothetical protein